MTRTGLRTGCVTSVACALGMLATTDVVAAGLRVQADAARSATGMPSEFLIRVSNDGPTALSDLRVYAPDDVQISCGSATSAGRSFALGGTLSAGDDATCIGWQSAGVEGSRSIGITVSASEPSGAVQSRHTSVITLGSVLTPAQGAVVLMAGVIHADTDADGRLDAGELLNYHYTILNVGSVALSALAATDLAGAVSCPQTTLAVGANMICTRAYTITPANATSGVVVNDARVQGLGVSNRPANGGDVIVSLNLAGTAGIRVFKSPLLLNDADASGFASAGDLLRYTFIVKNGNAQTLSSVNLVEPDPTRIDTPIVCAPTTLSGASYSGNGTGTLTANDVISCSAGYTVRIADANLGQVLNLVEARANAVVGGPIIATGASAVVVPSGFAIAVSKTVNRPDAFPGEFVIYTITLSNPGTLPVANVTLSDPIPVGMATFNWTCSGASCPNPSGTGPILQTIPSFPADARVVYTVRATLAPDVTQAVINTVTVTPPTGVTCQPSNLPPPCNATVPIVVLPLPMPIPSASAWSLLLLALAFVGMAGSQVRRN
jgi:uncharacterized repeat protein (TIGR01451 family)